MSKTRQQKQDNLQSLQQNLKEVKSIVLVDYCGLKVKETEELRRALKKEACKYFVAKKTLLKLALKDINLDSSNIDALVGGIGMIFGFEDEVAPARIVADFAKKYQALKIHGGFLDQEFVDENKIRELAKLPTKDQMMAKTVATIKAPITSFVFALKGNLNNLVYVIKAIQADKA